jgi:hypothetical protein
MLQGAVLHMAELGEHGDYRLTEAQQARIDDLLNESDSVTLFVRQCVHPASGEDLTTDELVTAYCDYCDEKGWAAKERRAVCDILPDLMLQVHRVGRRHDIKRDNKSQRGYAEVELLCPSNSPY